MISGGSRRRECLKPAKKQALRRPERCAAPVQPCLSLPEPSPPRRENRSGFPGSEVFGTGTAAVISPVGELRYEGDVAHINNGEIGEITHKLYNTLTGIQWGKLPDDMGWTVKI